MAFTPIPKRITCMTLEPNERQPSTPPPPCLHELFTIPALTLQTLKNKKKNDLETNNDTTENHWGILRPPIPLDAEVQYTQHTPSKIKRPAAHTVSTSVINWGIRLQRTTVWRIYFLGQWVNLLVSTLVQTLTMTMFLTKDTQQALEIGYFLTWSSYIFRDWRFDLELTIFRHTVNKIFSSK